MTASTSSYLWSVEDVVGQGATASVYTARHKRTGQQVAVKVFNKISYSRSQDVQMREFEILRKLNHYNIVRLFAVEELPTKQKVLVMEYCSGGSLLNLLEKPENDFGLPETEFLIVLQCVVQGMNHLRENDVVHRDIKPGNIMRLLGEDGRSVYKLTDFGAARELQDDQKFESIYGTEEYLHPDMYQRAVLRQPQGKVYGVAVDLWSIGVTFYHAATGSLPFKPYGGARKSKGTMHQMTSQKPVGVIAAYQLSEDGPIEWVYQLPHSCPLTQGLRAHLVPVLAGILEADQEHCWSFDQFFMATTDVLKRDPIHVFSLLQATASCVYIHHHNTVSMFLEEVASQTGLVVEKLQILYLGYELPLEGSMKVVNLPPTSASQPLLLLGPGPDVSQGHLLREPKTPVIPPRFDVLADFRFSKVIIGVMHRFVRMVGTLCTQRELLLQGYYTYMMKQRRECESAMVSITMVTIRLQACIHLEYKISQYPPDIPGLMENKKKLQLVRERLPVYVGGIRQFQNELEHLLIEHAKLVEGLANDKCHQKTNMLLEKIMAVHQLYRKDKQRDKLGYNDEQIHKFEKIHLSDYIKRMKTLFRDDSVQRYKDLLVRVSTWSSVLVGIQSRLEDFSSFSRGLLADLEMCDLQLNKALDMVLLSFQSGRDAPQAGDMPIEETHMVLRLNHMKEEMEVLVQELECNNSIIEGSVPRQHVGSLSDATTTTTACLCRMGLTPADFMSTHSLEAVSPAVAALTPSLSRPSTL